MRTAILTIEDLLNPVIENRGECWSCIHDLLDLTWNNHSALQFSPKTAYEKFNSVYVAKNFIQDQFVDETSFTAGGLAQASNITNSAIIHCLRRKDINVLKTFRDEIQGIPYELNSLVVLGLAQHFNYVNGMLTGWMGNADLWNRISAGSAFDNEFLYMNLDSHLFSYGSGDNRLLTAAARSLVRGTEIGTPLLTAPKIDPWEGKQATIFMSFIKGAFEEVWDQVKSGNHDSVFSVFCDHLVTAFKIDRGTFLYQIENQFGERQLTMISSRLRHVWELPFEKR